MSEIINVFGLGKFGSNSHPVHPATIHIPIAFLLTASILDILAFIGQTSPGLLYPLMYCTTHTSTFPNKLDTIALLNYLSLFSYASTIAALFTSLPALTTGIAELYAMIQARGLDFSNLDPVVKTTLIHAGLNDVAVVGAAYNWLSRRGRTGFTLDTGNFLVSATILMGVIYSAYLGGTLIYSHGVGVQRQGKGAQEKEKATKKTKAQAKKES